MVSHSRRTFLSLAAGAAAAKAQSQPYEQRATVSLVRGEDRRKNVCNALVAVDDQIRPALKRKKYVLLKPNCVAVNNQLGSTHADALRGILDYLAPRFKGPIVIADSSKDVTWDAYENFHYHRVVSEYRAQKVSLVDFNDEERFVAQEIVDRDLHLTQVRLAGRMFDPDAFILGSAILKAHDNVVATLSVKNLVMSAPLHNSRKETRKWHDKARYHAGYRQIQMNLAITARRMRPFWGATVIDGFEGMEGEGPLRGTPVPSRVAIASVDLVAADRVGVEAMGVNPEWPGYLQYCCNAGLGQYDLAKIDLRGGVSIESIRKKYKLHPRIDRQLEWMGALPKPA
ncbi:MAG: DUF362 domain-containing protein [Acidobacteria bacterium]|nr:DUF362 domain-containing protein [Acidobacteriota bacterium]